MVPIMKKNTSKNRRVLSGAIYPLQLLYEAPFPLLSQLLIPFLPLRTLLFLLSSFLASSKFLTPRSLLALSLSFRKTDCHCVFLLVFRVILMSLLAILRAFLPAFLRAFLLSAHFQSTYKVEEYVHGKSCFCICQKDQISLSIVS